MKLLVLYCFMLCNGYVQLQRKIDLHLHLTQTQLPTTSPYIGAAQTIYPLGQQCMLLLHALNDIWLTCYMQTLGPDGRMRSRLA